MSVLSYYPRALSLLHWVSVPAITGAVGTVLYSQQVPKEEKGKWMFRHKSLGLLAGLVMVPRLAIKLGSTAPSHAASMFTGTATLEQLLAKASHYGLYAFGIIMPATGVVMGLNGAGLPFFNTTLKVPTLKGKLPAKEMFWVHKNFGYYAKFILPLHVGAAGAHYARGHAIFQRINPFR